MTRKTLKKYMTVLKTINQGLKSSSPKCVIMVALELKQLIYFAAMSERNIVNKLNNSKKIPITLY